MKIARLISFCLLGACFQLAAAQQKTESAPDIGYRAVVDLEKIKTQHKRYQKMLDEIGQDEAAAAADFEQRRQKIAHLSRQRKTLSPLSDKSVALMHAIIAEQTALKFQEESSAGEFQQRRKKLEFALYQEVVKEISFFAHRHRIDIVLNHQSSAVDDDPSLEEARALFTRDVPYQQNIDITDQILRACIIPRRPGPFPVRRPPR